MLIIIKRSRKKPNTIIYFKYNIIQNWKYNVQCLKYKNKSFIITENIGLMTDEWFTFIEIFITSIDMSIVSVFRKMFLMNNNCIIQRA